MNHDFSNSMVSMVLATRSTHTWDRWWPAFTSFWTRRSATARFLGSLISGCLVGRVGDATRARDVIAEVERTTVGYA